MKGRLEWLSVLRGLCILLVVMFHVQLVCLATGENHEECVLLTQPFTPFRMPLFIFTSGGLLFLSRINKQVGTLDLYIDKFKRIVIPFLFFTCLYYLIKVSLSFLVKTPIDLSLSAFLECFYLFDGHPSAPLWFLAVLMIFMLMYPFFYRIIRSHVLTGLFLLFTILFYFIDLSGLLPQNYFYLLRINHYLVYFFTGIVFFRYRYYDYTGNIKALLLLALLNAILYYYEIPILQSIAGILLLTSCCQLLVKHVTGVFSSFRDYIYQIYLLSIIFQAFVELILWRRLFYDEQLFWLFYVLNVVAGIYGPVLVCKLLEKISYKPLLLAFGLNKKN